MKIRTKNFNLEATLDSAQVFGFVKNEEGLPKYTGILKGVNLTLWQEGPVLNVSTEEKSIKKHIETYFDLKRDLSQEYAVLEREEKLRESFEKFKGLRIIRQDSWEAIACFIISANNNFKRIQNIWHQLSENLSRKNSCFPSFDEVAASSEKELRDLGLGYRAPYLFKTAQGVKENPECLNQIRKSDYEEAKRLLVQFPGIGPKVADCVLLYGFQKYEAFPVDVWILRIMRKLYFGNRKVSEKRVLEYAQKRWGSCAGYVQQYVFHGGRMGVL